MRDRTKLLINVRRLSTALRNAINNGPDGEIKQGDQSTVPEWMPDFIHYATGLYLAGAFAYLEGDDHSYSWDKPGSAYSNFTTFANENGPTKGGTYASRKISWTNLQVLAQVRNAVVHHDGDLKDNRNKKSFANSSRRRPPRRISEWNRNHPTTEFLEDAQTLYLCGPAIPW